MECATIKISLANLYIGLKFALQRMYFFPEEMILVFEETVTTNDEGYRSNNGQEGLATLFHFHLILRTHQNA